MLWSFILCVAFLFQFALPSAGGMLDSSLDVTYDGVNIILIGRAPTTLEFISDLNLLVSVG